MRTNLDAVRDIKSAPYRDMFDQEIIPGMLLCIEDEYGNQYGGKVEIKDGAVMMGNLLIDDIIESNPPAMFVAGWIQ